MKSESRSRFPVAVYEGLKQMETKTTDFSATLKYKGNTRPLCIFSLPPNSSLYFLKTGSTLQGEECSCKVMEIPKGVCFSSFQPNWKSAEESSSGPRPDLTVNFNLAKLVLVSTSSSDVSRKTDFDSTSREFWMDSKMEKHSLIEKGKLRLLDWTISGKSYLQREFPKMLQSLSQVPKEKV